VGITGECDSTTYYVHGIVFTIDKHYFNSNYYDICYSEYVQYILSSFMIAKLSNIEKEVKK
jgi:hypothetical protein